ncbi:MAG TPA: hypothetical protein VM912_03150 [Terriglobales bacterium]|nr:hypothetical protein [Terriglobales bacterium]
MDLLDVRRVAGIMLLVPFACLAVAQQEPPFSATQTSIVVAAEPRHSKDVPVIRSEDVTVMQGKQRDQVISLQPIFSSQAGVQLFILIDDSLSTQELGTKLNDIRQFITSQPGNVQIGIAYMRNGTAMIAQNLTGDHSQAAKALRLTTGEFAGSASPYFSLEDLLKRWPETNSVREVVMITDGVDSYWDESNLDDPYVNSAIEQAQRQGVVVNAIYERGVGHFGHTLWRITLAQNFLSQIADSTGGEAY